MKRRHLFAEVKNFLLYDFFTPEGYVNEDVFAYSNRTDDERALVIYHNKYEFCPRMGSNLSCLFRWRRG